MTRVSDPLQLGRSTLRNRIVTTTHGSGLVRDGLALPGDDAYWRRIAHGGTAMAIVGGTTVAPESTWRSGLVVEAYRDEAIPGLRRRAEAIRSGGALPVQQLVHLGRETVGVPVWYHPVAPSAVRSPREQVAARSLAHDEIPSIVDWFARSAGNVAEAGYDGIEIHAAHGYLVAQFLSELSNTRGDEYGGTLENRFRLLAELISAIRTAAPGLLLGARLSVEPGLDVPELARIVRLLGASVDWVNITVGPRGDYVRDMATEAPPLLGAFAPIRDACAVPLLVAQAFRDRGQLERALAEGADLVGLARPFIADPEFARKLLDGRDGEIRPCVSCNEDCRLFDPILLCTVNPELGLPGEPRRRARPLVLQHGGGEGSVAIVGGGVAGLECAVTLAGAGRNVVLYEATGALGGAVATAALAPNRRGWRRILDFYERQLATVDVRLVTDVTPVGVAEVVIATGAEETLPKLDGIEHARRSSDVVAEGLDGAERVVILDDGFGWWPGINVLELAIAAGARITFVTPLGTFATGLPHESRAQLVPRLAGARIDTRSFVELVAFERGAVVTRHRFTGEPGRLEGDVLVVVGERRPRAFHAAADGARVQVIGDAVVPRRVSHAIAEGRAAAAAILG